jgi:hypothetical protein
MGLARMSLSEGDLSIRDTSLWFQELRLETYRTPLAQLSSLGMLLGMLLGMSHEMLVWMSLGMLVWRFPVIAEEECWPQTRFCW